MNYLIPLITILLAGPLKASVDLKVGDILLQPLDCWSCSLIEDEEQTIYSHMGIVISVDPVMVADSRRKVEKQTWLSFNSITEMGQQIRVLRFRNEKIVDELQNNGARFEALFTTEFEGLAYDHDFRWNNLDANGDQKLYCSEMVAKLLQAFLGIDSIGKYMHFSRNPDQWARYFRGNVPVGLWGNAPADFERSDLFYVVGDL